MKRICLTIFASIMLFAAGCNSAGGSDDCNQAMLDRFDMVKYNGEDPGCNNTLALYTVFGKQFFALENNCADMIFDPLDCEGKKLFRDGNFHEESLFRNFSKREGTIGISR